MKVKELIEKLQEFDPEMEVLYDGDGISLSVDELTIVNMNFELADGRWTELKDYVFIY